jgi:hypothetical protein
LTLFDSVTLYYRALIIGIRGSVPAGGRWEFSPEGWKAYQVGMAQKGLSRDKTNAVAVGPTCIYNYPIEIIEDGPQGYWYRLVIDGVTPLPEGRFPFLLPLRKP